jgi:hypothetical protein
MQRSLLNCTIVVFFVAISLSARADVYKAGDSLIGFSAPDQHGTDLPFKAGDAKVILFDTPAADGTSQPSPEPDWFAKNHVLPVVNVSDLSFLKRKVAQTRMAAKTYRLLVVDTKSVAERFPVQQGKFTVLFLNERGVITDIRFATPGQELRELLINKTATSG